MKFLFLYSSLALLFFSCKNEAALNYSLESFSESDLDICQNEPCSKLDIEYVKVIGNTEITTIINTQIEAYIIQTLFLGEDKNPSAKTVKEAASQFILAYRDHKNQFEYEVPYEAAIEVSKTFENKTLLCLQLYSYLYTGGAHGFGSTIFKNFDLETGDEISVKNLFTNFEEFLPFAENAFREAYNIPKNESINSTGFWFEEDTFSLPDTVGISKNSLLFIYNSYDIASYAEGPIALEIPLKKANPYLSKTFFQ
ncbi:MAG: DUF4163 domain-containing protein [Flavobacteriaceae bacterium]